MSVVCRKPPLSLGFSVSALGKVSGRGGRNSAISDLAAVISNIFAKADSQISGLGVSCRPN
jgi:hypothetical protein